MSETLDPAQGGKKAAAVASPELLVAGHSEKKRRLEKSCLSTGAASEGEISG